MRVRARPKRRIISPAALVIHFGFGSQQ